MSWSVRKAETTFSRELRAALHKMKVMTFKINDRVRRGTPDIYFTTGNWIEAKVIGTMPTIKNYPLKYFTAMQRITMDTLVQRGDTCFVAILWYGEHDRSLLIMPWYVFRRIRLWDTHTLAHFSQPYIGPFSMKLAEFGWEEGKWNGARWKAEKLDTWAHKGNIRVFDTNLVPDQLEMGEIEEDEQEAVAG